MTRNISQFSVFKQLSKQPWPTQPIGLGPWSQPDDCSCHIVTQKPRPSLGFQTSVLSWELLTTPIMGKNHWPRDPPPLQEGDISDRMSNLSNPLILALTSDARDLESGLTQKSWPSLGSQTSVLRLLAHKPSILAIQNYNAALCLPTRRKTLLSLATQKPPMRINQLHPKYIGWLGH